MKTLDLKAMREAVLERRIEWRKHVLQKLAERNIAQSDVLDVMVSGERIRNYTDDRPFPSVLILGYVNGKPLHVVAAFDEIDRRAFVVTAYEPSSDVFESDYRTRRKP